ncbi:MAG: NYN domain-containing protein [Luteibacter sp.]
MGRWTIKPDAIEKLLKGSLAFDDMDADHIVPNARQKGVDMRIGIDVTTLALKRRVDQIVLMAGDADFVPAAKQARREGIDFILDPLWGNIPDGLQEHIDGLRTTCPRPRQPVACLR